MTNPVMTNTATTHRLVALVSSMREALAGMAGVDPAYMTTAEKATALGDLRKLVSSVSELYLRVLANADDLALETGARDVAAWLAATQLADPRAARADLGLAVSLLKYPRLAAAMAAGTVSVEQARVIVRALTALPEDLAAAEAELNGSAGPDADSDGDSADAAARTPIDVETVMDRAEAELVRLAGGFRPSELTRLGRHLLEVVAPEVADAADEAALKRAEKNAAERTALSLRSNGDGSTRITGTVSDQIAARLRAYLEAFAQPRVAALDADGERMPTHRLHGLAFGDLMERIDPTTLPDHGGDATTVMVILDYEYLMRQTGAYAGTTAAWATEGTGARPHGPGADDADGAGATASGSRAGTMTTSHTARRTDSSADQGETSTADAGEAAARAAAATLGETRISAGEARRLACQARIVPVVLDGQSQPLDLGRAKRLFTPAQRKAVRIRDGGCRAEGCTAPPAWCDVHHLHAWADGGPTDLANGISLCAHHHHKIHDTTYHHEHTPAGRVTFHARQ